MTGRTITGRPISPFSDSESESDDSESEDDVDLRTRRTRRIDLSLRPRERKEAQPRYEKRLCEKSPGDEIKFVQILEEKEKPVGDAGAAYL